MGGGDRSGAKRRGRGRGRREVGIVGYVIRGGKEGNGECRGRAKADERS